MKPSTLLETVATIIASRPPLEVGTRWLDVLEALIKEMKKENVLRQMSLKTIEETPLFWDSQGDATIGKRGGTRNLIFEGKVDLSTRIFCPTDRDEVRALSNRMEDDPSKPNQITQKFLGLSRNCNWCFMEVRSEILVQGTGSGSTTTWQPLSFCGYWVEGNNGRLRPHLIPAYTGSNVQGLVVGLKHAFRGYIREQVKRLQQLRDLVDPIEELQRELGG
jgi:hypothetical protein